MSLSADELPDDPIGFEDAYSSISYADRSLIIYYMVHQYNMVAYNYRYYKSGTDNSINWVIMPSVVEDKNSANNDFVFTRFAIMVPKPVDSSNLNIWMAVQRTTD